MVKPLKNKAKQYLKQRGFYKELLKEKLELEEANRNLERVVKLNKDLIDYRWFVEPGHFYSPLISDKEGDFSHLVDLWSPNGTEIELPGVAINKKGQAALLAELAKYSQELDEYLEKGTDRFRIDNDQIGHSDRSFLYLMLRNFKPKQVIEVGSGWTSALMLDVNDRYPKQTAALTFIEPYPERLLSTLKRSDKKRCKIIAKKVQKVDVQQFEKLNSGDLLFIDNSHVSKSGSDVNFLIFEVLPRLKRGVIVHIHDIFYPFEYPWQWVVEDKRNWNEAYVVRALLTGSNMFEIIMWPSYLLTASPDNVRRLIPATKDFGSSLWLRKT